MHALYNPYFATSYSLEITFEAIESCSNEEIAELCLKARQDGAPGEIWFAIEERLARGNKLYLLTSEQLLKMKYAFEGHSKAGTPGFGTSIRSLELAISLPSIDCLFYRQMQYSKGKRDRVPFV